MEKRTVTFMILSLFCMSFFASALFVTEPNDVYNLGDKLFVTATGLKGYDTGNLNIDLICTSENKTTVNLLKIPARGFSPEGGDSYSIPYKYLTSEDLEIDDIHAIVGECLIRTNLADEVLETKAFTITDEIRLFASADKVNYNPGESIELTLDASRADGEYFVGEWRGSNFTALAGEFLEESSGQAKVSVEIPDTQTPGSYFLNFIALNVEESGTITNEGTYDLFFIVNQVPTSIDPIASQYEVIPGETIVFSPNILDQAGGVVPGTISMHLTDPDENKYDYTLQSGDTITIPFETNNTKGAWTAHFLYNTIHESYTFELLGLEKLDYELVNSVLTIKNIGNTEYFGVVEIEIGGEIHEVELRLPMGATKDFVLEAPEGEYSINVDDGDVSFSGNSFLTGNAVGVREKGTYSSGDFSFLLIVFLFVGGSLGIIMLGIFRRKKKVTEEVSVKNTEVKSADSSNTQTEKPVKNERRGLFGFRRIKKEKTEEVKDLDPNTGMIDVSTGSRGVTTAQSALVLHGDKIESTIVSILLKDMDAFTPEIQKELISIIKRNCGAKGVIDQKGDFIYLIYSPLVSRSYRNEFTGVSAALKISAELQEYTKNLSGELKFGIGVHNGFLVSKRTGQKLQYTSIGNTFSFANKMAEESENTVFMSDASRKKIIRDVHAVKVAETAHNVIYKVSEVKDKVKNEAKLADLLGRMKD